jgi:hypothetical protein
VLEQQIGTPGERAAALCRVDPRTGRRVALWRTVALVVALAAAQALRDFVFELNGQAMGVEREELRRQARSVRERHPDDADARREAMRRFVAQRQPRGCWPQLLVSGAYVVLERLLRRRLAPTVVVERGRQGRQGR